MNHDRKNNIATIAIFGSLLLTVILAAGTMVTRDVYQRVLHPEATGEALQEMQAHITNPAAESAAMAQTENEPDSGHDGQDGQRDDQSDPSAQGPGDRAEDMLDQESPEFRPLEKQQDDQEDDDGEDIPAPLQDCRPQHPVIRGRCRPVCGSTGLWRVMMPQRTNSPEYGITRLATLLILMPLIQGRRRVEGSRG